MLPPDIPESYNRPPGRPRVRCHRPEAEEIHSRISSKRSSLLRPLRVPPFSNGHQLNKPTSTGLILCQRDQTFPVGIRHGNCVNLYFQACRKSRVNSQQDLRQKILTGNGANVLASGVSRLMLISSSPASTSSGRMALTRVPLVVMAIFQCPNFFLTCGSAPGSLSWQAVLLRSAGSW